MTDYSEQQLIGALRKADAAGDVAAAQAIARRIQTMRTAAPKADFSAVRSTKATTETGPPPRSTLQEAGRSLGLGARGMIRGAGDIVGIAADPFIQGANALGANQATMRQGADRLADTLGLPSPETPTERVSSGITSALTGGGGLIGLGRGMAAQGPGIVRDVGRTLSAMPRTQLASLVGGSGASETTREMGGSPGAQMTAGLIGGLGPSFGMAGIQGAPRVMARGGEQGRQNMERSLKDFASVGAAPSVGQAAGNRRMQGLESLLAGAPTSTGVMGRAAERQADDIGTGLQGLANRLVPNASAERAGRAVERGAETFAGNVKATKKALYWQADQFIPDDTPLALSRTQMALAELTTPNQGAMATTGALINPKIGQMAQNVSDDLAANSGSMPYAAVRELRSRIGEELSDFSLSADKPTAQYKRLYAALSQDLEEAARRQGPNAEQAAKRANNYTRAAADRLEQVQRVVDKNGGPEKIYNAVMSGTQDGGTTLRAVMQSLPKDGQKALTGAVIKRMGLATPGQQGAAGDTFSSQTFLTNWNKVSPEAKRALFDRHGPKFVADMDKVARVAQTIRDGSRVFANPSGTANKGLAYTYAGSLGVALLTGQVGAFGGLAAGGALTNAMARAMTSPKVVAWLAKATEMPVSALPQQILILKAAGRNDPEVAEFVQALEQEEGNQ
jgi:hypothetical protein